MKRDMYFENATRDIRTLPKLEGTVHVNMALVVKFMANYFFNPAEFPVIPKRTDPADDEFLFNQGPTRGLGKIRFHDYNLAYAGVDLPNANIFKEQIGLLKELLISAPPSKEQSKDIDFLLSLGELFTLVAYGQLIIEEAGLKETDRDVLDQIFDFMIREFFQVRPPAFPKTGNERGSGGPVSENDQESGQGHGKISAGLGKPHRQAGRFLRTESLKQGSCIDYRLTGAVLRARQPSS